MAKDIEQPVCERASVFLASVVCQRQQPSARTRHARGTLRNYKTTQQQKSWLLQSCRVARRYRLQYREDELSRTNFTRYIQTFNVSSC
jgi:CHASE1-domain containing sensor protein